MLNGSKKIKITNSSMVLLAILLLAVHLFSDFMADKQLVIAGIYVVLLGFSLAMCAKKDNLYEVVYTLVAVMILGEILKNCVPYVKNMGWLWTTLTAQYGFLAGSYAESLLSSPYVYFYFVGLLLLIISKFAPSLCRSSFMKSVFDALGKHSFWAFILHMNAICFTKYELIENAIFFVFIICAFWSAYTRNSSSTTSVIKATVLVIELSLFILLFPKQYTVFVEGFQSAQGITWFYSIGLFVICVLCILSERAIQDIIIGFVILGTNILYFFGKLNQVIFSPRIIVLFHIGAISLFYIVKNVFALDDKKQKKWCLKGCLASCYIVALMLTIFLAYHLTHSITMLCIALVFLLIYFGNFFGIKGTVYGTAMYGAIPWILLETTIDSLGKMNASLFAVILFTVLFWCTCSVALSWKDTTHIKAIAFEKANSEMIVNILSGTAYLLTALVLFL